MFLPIRTEAPVQARPIANYALIGVNLAVWLVFEIFLRQQGESLKARGMLHTWSPQVWEFITYQFLHASGWQHIAANMLFLYVFGNAVNSKMGNPGYVLFYISGGVAAAIGFTWLNQDALLVGASGAVAAVTTAYLVLYPRSNVTVLYFIFFFWGVVQVPSMILISVKIIFWDNILTPRLMPPGVSNVAYSCHLAGYLFGLSISMILLWVRGLPRDQFDLMAIWQRRLRRRAFAEAYRGSDGASQGQYGRVARKAYDNSNFSDQSSDGSLESEIMEIRGKISEAFSRRDVSAAADGYAELRRLDGGQILPFRQQIDVANQLMSSSAYNAAAEAYEDSLRVYPNMDDAEQIHLLLGILYGRYLSRPEDAKSHLETACEDLADPNQIQMAKDILSGLP
jgi:membrane associated rhomboid family serine protease